MNRHRREYRVSHKLPGTSRVVSNFKLDLKFLHQKYTQLKSELTPDFWDYYKAFSVYVALQALLEKDKRVFNFMEEQCKIGTVEKKIFEHNLRLFGFNFL